ncbi:MAG: hypothetical protein K6U14_04920 [Firmicutes bacterium]|nr:hypothetical protein [Alicyclobacillaceae bacterium]MCL6496963.1 hypothetical protein [Bacillota bacterium]
MRLVLALAVAMATSVVGVAVGRHQRPWSRLPLAWVVAAAAIGSGLAELGTVWVNGPPHWVLQPMAGGLVIGWVAAFFSGRRPPAGGPRG